MIHEVWLDDAKMAAAWERCARAPGLHLLALSYCMGHRTGGHLPRDFVEEMEPDEAERERVLAVLREVSLWTPDGDGWLLRVEVRSPECEHRRRA